MINIRYIVLCFCCVWGLNGCTGMPQDMQDISSRLDKQETQLQRVSAQVGLGTEGMVPGQAEVWAEIQSLRQDLNLLRGDMDDLASGGASGTEAQQMHEEVRALGAALRRMSSELGIELPMLDNKPISAAAAGASLAGAAVAGSAGTVSNAVPIASAQPQSADLAKKLYDSGTKAFSDRKYADAVRIFTDFITVYPKHSLISNAHFWQGESYYQMQGYNNAILSYQQVIEKYPGSNKLQSSMLKQGMAMQKSGKTDAARERLNELIYKYPKSQEASRAKQFLENNL